METIDISELKINENVVIWREISPGEVFCINKENKKFFEFNKTGAFIWLCLGKKTNAFVVKKLTKAYPKVKKEQVEKDLSVFLKTLLRKKFIVASGERKRMRSREPKMNKIIFDDKYKKPAISEIKMLDSKKIGVAGSTYSSCCGGCCGCSCCW